MVAVLWVLEDQTLPSCRARGCDPTAPSVFPHQNHSTRHIFRSYLRPFILTLDILVTLATVFVFAEIPVLSCSKVDALAVLLSAENLSCKACV